MRKLLLLILFIIIGINTSFAGDFILTGSTIQQSGGKIVLPNDASGVYINNDNYLNNSTSDLDIKGNFWYSDLSTVSNQTLGWSTFDIGSVPGVQKVALKNNLDGTFTFTGFAWSNAGGWIYFGDTGVSNGKVIYTLSTGLISGCAWSQNLGWMCIESSLSMDSSAPNLTNILKPTATNHQKQYTLSELSNVKIENWDSTAMTTYNNVTTFIHDMRKSKNYYIEATDMYGNTSTGYIQVVAGVPNETLSPYNIGGTAIPTIYGGSLGNNKIGDGYDNHSINIKLRDTYGNPVIPASGIKNIELTLGFDNNLDKEQIGINDLDLGDAINFLNNDFVGLISGIGNTEGTSTNKFDGNYDVDITSFAPSTAGYSYTTINNDIKVNKLIVLVTALNGNTGVGEYNANMTGIKYTSAFKFIPTVKLNSILNSDNGNISRDNETSFTGEIIANKLNTLTIQNLKLSHILDTYTGGTYKNNIINFQNILGSSIYCIGYYTGTGYYSSNSECDRLAPNKSSNLIKTLGNISSNITFNDTFKSTPRLVTSGLDKFDTKYSSEISYTLGGNYIKYPSINYLFSSSITNNEIKVAGLVNKNNNNFSVIQDSSINYIGTLNKTDIFAMIHKNVAIYQKSGTGANGIKYVKGDFTLNSWPSGIDTIIVDGGDLIVNTDISKVTGSIKILITLKDANGTKGNIWIKNGVQKVYAALIADRAVLSGDGTIYYSDSKSANNQLFVKGSVISYNTIGGSSTTPSSCPYYVTSTCDLQTSKRYDFNHFRSYIKGVSGNPVPGITMFPGYDIAPMIIEYDSDIQKNPPSILNIN
nr:hypothetical protein [Candidatus Gracilibacteria bacterium]